MPNLTPIPEGMKITKLPPGKALGSDGLTDWSHKLSGGNVAQRKIWAKDTREKIDFIVRGSGLEGKAKKKLRSKLEKKFFGKKKRVTD